MHTLEIKARGLEATKPLKDYISQKLGKISSIIQSDIYIDCTIGKISKNTKFPNSFRVEVTLHISHTNLHVEKKGTNVYELIDKVETILLRMVKKYKGKKTHKNKRIKLSEVLTLM